MVGKTSKTNKTGRYDPDPVLAVVQINDQTHVIEAVDHVRNEHANQVGLYIERDGSGIDVQVPVETVTLAKTDAGREWLRDALDLDVSVSESQSGEQDDSEDVESWGPRDNAEVTTDGGRLTCKWGPCDRPAAEDEDWYEGYCSEACREAGLGIDDVPLMGRWE